MLRSIGFLLLLAGSMVIAGCRTPPPSFNPFVGFGSPRVPPPATGSYGSPPDNYYPSATPPGGSASRSTGFQQPTIPGSLPAQVQGWQPTGSGSGPSTLPNAQALGTGVQANAAAQASFTTPLSSSVNNPLSYGPPARGALNPSNTATPGITQLNPMRINDATQSALPGRFTPSGNAVNIAQLPSSIRPALPQSNRIRGYSPPTFLGVAPSSVVPTPGAAYNAAGVATSATATPPPPGQTNLQAHQDGWQPKYTPNVSGGTILR